MSGTLVAVLALGLGTYAFRLVGPVLHGRVELSERTRTLLARGAAVLLVALLTTGTLLEAGAFAGWARPLGVGAAAVVAWRGAPFAVTVLTAAAATGVLRAFGVP
ncbi:AzlD domain-containing protein [Streptomyces sp. SID4919]|uniref:AzlD domain-containing protein n=1 Tax=unclassified Streptomyces TaxID=2593676 RepID=UPI0008238342|nr:MULTISPECIES: AzlD domain-containing protein [unclassified Streptomyces]MYY10006.1 AzlD domain-containing protein [Streptomyces sp. SID4919]SCK63534.1 Branched-chain amino acid transport protein (AzlD) [Streptomyces sp. AmelKG-E11A]